MDNRKFQTVENSFQPVTNHEDAINVDGLEDLFHWASEMVADGADPRARRTREQKLRRNVLEIIQKNKEIEAREVYAEEVDYLQKRVMALLQIISEKLEQNSSLQLVIVTQFFALSRVAQLEDEVKQLQAMTWYRDEAEAERKHLMDAISKLKKERDYLDELVTANETENTRLAKAYAQTRKELQDLKNRRWWHPAFDALKRLQSSGS